MSNLKTYVTALFCASFRSCLQKKTGILKMCSFGKFLDFSQKFQFFSKTLVPIFKKKVPMEKLAALLCACIIR